MTDILPKKSLSLSTKKSKQQKQTPQTQRHCVKHVNQDPVNHLLILFAKNIAIDNADL
jgi:hypothetical protein